MVKASIVLLWAAALTAKSCQAFHVPTCAGSSSSRLQRQDRTSRNYLPRCRRHSCNAVTSAVVGQRRGRGAGVAAISAAEKAVEADTHSTESKKVEADKVVTESIKEAGKKYVRPARKLTPEEEAYLKRLAGAPTLYKRIPDAETFPSVGYDGAFESLEDIEKHNYSAIPTVKDNDGKEVILLRVVIVGGGDEEATFVKALSDKAAGKLVSGLYVLWDPERGELSKTLETVPFINVHELGSKNTKDPAKVAQHASFLGAHMIIVVSESSRNPEFVSSVKQEALKRGVTFVGPEVAAEVSEGNMETFTKLVEGTREAVAE